MTIRFTCAECDSVLKIKDELAGSPGRCPKCKTKFIVPSPQPGEQAPDQELVVHQADTSSSIDEAAVGTIPTAEPHPIAESHQEDLPVVSTVASSVKIMDEVEDELDLDSPPMFVALAIPHSKSVAEFESKKTEKPRIALANPTTANAATAAKRTEAFDPLKFLMDGPPVEKPQSFSSQAENDSDLSLSDDSDDELFARPMPQPLSRPTPQPLSRPTPVAPNSRATPEKVDLATAAKMMKKAIKDSQAETAHQRELEAKAGFDHTLFFREFGLRGLAILVAAAVTIPLVYYGFSYVLSSSMKLPKMGYVRGTVKLDGQPLSGAMVFFAPAEAGVEGSKRERWRTSVGVADEKGYFRMMYSPGDKIEGVAVGKCRVWVTHSGEKGNDVPTEWMELAMRTDEVTAGNQKAPYDINLVSKKSDPRKK